ncbi:MAG: hypothetical protein Q7R86_01210 [bacterium]|nr:hypothetical protein [bacterium]
MKRFSQAVISCLSLLILTFVVGCSDSNPTAPANMTDVSIKFVTPPSEEISGENTLDVNITNIETGKTYSLVLNSPEAVVFPDKTFYVLKGKIEIPTGDIGEKINYQLKATYLGINDSPSAPSRDVSHMVTINGISPFYGDERGMYFGVACSGDIEIMPNGDPTSTMLASSRPYFGVSQSWQGQFSGNTIKVIVEELVASSDGGSTWRPVFTSYDWTQQGILPTYRFSKVVTYELSWNTIAQLRPTTGEKFVRVKATIDYFGQSQVVTDQVSLNASGTEWTSANTDGYRVFRLTGGYGGKG